MPRSNIVPYRPDESGSARHARRLETNLRHLDKIKSWCDGVGVKIRITNGGHHWTFRFKGQVAEWWPSSAKFVIGRKYDYEQHLHDYAQVIRRLRRWVRRILR